MFLKEEFFRSPATQAEIDDSRKRGLSEIMNTQGSILWNSNFSNDHIEPSAKRNRDERFRTIRVESAESHALSSCVFECVILLSILGESKQKKEIHRRQKETAGVWLMLDQKATQVVEGRRPLTAQTSQKYSGR